MALYACFEPIFPQLNWLLWWVLRGSIHACFATNLPHLNWLLWRVLCSSIYACFAPILTQLNWLLWWVLCGSIYACFEPILPQSDTQGKSPSLNLLQSTCAPASFAAYTVKLLRQKWCWMPGWCLRGGEGGGWQCVCVGTKLVKLCIHYMSPRTDCAKCASLL